MPSQLFDDLPTQSIDARFVEACNRLATWSGGDVVLGFAFLDAADEATVTTCTQMLRHPGWVQTPDISNLLDILGDVEHRLTQAERLLGQLTLPGERHEKP